MCIDKLTIRFRNTTGDLGRPINSIQRMYSLGSSPNSAPHIDLNAVMQSLVYHGYNIDEGESFRRGWHYYHRHKIYRQGQELPISLLCRGDADNRNIYAVDSTPSLFSHYQDYWRVIEALDGHTENGYALNNGILDCGFVDRIDYACDYRVEHQRIMQGLHVTRGQTLIGYTDFDGNPYAAYQWNNSRFFSYRIGLGNKVIKIYDKRLEESRRRNRTEEEEETWEEESPETQGGAGREEASSLTDLPPKTRIEISITERSKVRTFWNRRYALDPITRQGVNLTEANTYEAMLRELPAHLEDIRRARHDPFAGIMLHHVSFRGVTPHNRNSEWWRIRHEIEAGLLMNVCKRIEAEHGNFWEAHQPYFALHPWYLTYQPTSVFQSRLMAWMTEDMTLNENGYFVPDDCYSRNRRSTARWDESLTHGTARRRTPSPRRGRPRRTPPPTE